MLGSFCIRDRYATSTRKGERHIVEAESGSKEAVMERRIVRLFAGALGALGTVAAVGTAGAEPNPAPVEPSIIDQLVTSTPVLSTNSSASGEAASKWGGVGMICQNLNVRCR